MPEVEYDEWGFPIVPVVRFSADPDVLPPVEPCRCGGADDGFHRTECPWYERPDSGPGMARVAE